MEAMIMTAQVLLSLSILVFVHEWGHFITARMFHIKVEKFYIFFDFLFPMPNVLKFSLLKYKKKDTEYGIGWFPLGGYVKIAGMMDESMDKKSMEAPPKPWEFRAKPAWQRLIVMLGGIIVNVIVGILIFVGLTYAMGDSYVTKTYVNNNGGIHALALAKTIGLQTGDKILKVNGEDFENFQQATNPDVFLSDNPYYTILRDEQEIAISIPENFIENFNKKESYSSFILPRFKAIIGGISKESLADRLALREGDRFLEINGHLITYQDELSDLVKGNAEDSISFTIERGTQHLSYTEFFKESKLIGVYPQGVSSKDMSHIDYSLGGSLVVGTERAFDVIFLQLKAFKKMFSGQLSFTKSLSGPIGIAKMFGADWNWTRFWHITGLLSMVLAFMNLLPIPALDGGYVVFLLYEMVTRKKHSEKFFEKTIQVGMLLIMLLMIFVFYNDIAKLFTG